MPRVNQIPDEQYIPLVAYGAIAVENLSGNRKIPVLSLNLSTRPDVRDLFAVHQDSPPGDALSRWCAPRFGKKHLVLLIEFVRPARIVFAVQFSVEAHGGLIEGIDHAKLVFLREGRAVESDEEVDNSMKNGIYVEVGAKGFPVDWKSWYKKALTKKFKKVGLDKKGAEQAAKDVINTEFSFWHSPVNVPSDESKGRD